MGVREIQHHVMFKAIGGRPCLAWPMPAERAAEMPPDSIRESAFADFPNIGTPTELLNVYERLVRPPVYPRYEKEDFENIAKPEMLLEMFDIAPTQKNLNEAKYLLAVPSVHSETWAMLPVSDCLTMSRDMKALLTVLAFSYGRCDMRTLSLNTQHGFAFINEFYEGESPYGDFLLHVREDDPNVLELDRTFIYRDIQKTVQSKGGKPASKTIKSMQRFAEGYINSFMWTVHPVLWDGVFTSMSKADGLSDIYAYWAQRAAKDKILACANCGKLIANTRKNQMYCSKSCKVQACNSRSATNPAR